VCFLSYEGRFYFIPTPSTKPHSVLRIRLAHLGEENAAMDWLEKVYEERVGYMLMIERDPALDILRNSARFHSFSQKIGPHAS